MYDGGRALPQCCFNDGPHFQRSGDVGTVLFQCITLITFEILFQTSQNFQGSRRNGCEWCVQKLHVKRLRIDWDINEKRYAGVVTTLAQCFALITFEVLNRTPPNLLGSCRSSSRWYLQNYIKNGWELTSELRLNEYIYWNTQANFTLISLITFEVLSQTLQNSQGSGHNTIRWCLQNYMEDSWELTSELTSK